jgi:hypothetical protein
VAFTSITLSDPATGQASVIMPRDGVTAMSLDVQPSVRAVEEERVAASGTVDTTSFLSAAAATLTMRLWQAADGSLPEGFIDELGALLTPSRRCALICVNDQWAQARQLTVRFDSKTVPVDVPWPLDMAVGWKVPAGVWEAVTTLAVTLNPLLTGGPGLRFTAAPTDNYLTGQNAGFEGGIGTWVANANCAVAATAAQAHGGTGSLKMTSTAGGDMTAASVVAGNILTISGLPCSAGDRIDVSAWHRAAVSPRSCQPGADFYDQAGAFISSVFDTGHAVTDSTSAWTQTVGSVVAPAAAARARYAPKVVATGAGAEDHYVDDVYLARQGLNVAPAIGFDWPAAPVGGDTTVTVAGNQPCWWTAALYGPCTGPKLANDALGVDLIFADTLVLGSGEFVQVDPLARTAFKNGDPTQPVVINLDLANTSWWQLRPGSNLLRYHPTAAAAGSVAVVSYRPAWLA